MESRRFPYLRLQIPSLLRHFRSDCYRGHLNNQKPFYMSNRYFLSGELSSRCLVVGNKMEVAVEIGGAYGGVKGPNHVVYLFVGKKCSNLNSLAVYVIYHPICIQKQPDYTKTRLKYQKYRNQENSCLVSPSYHSCRFLHTVIRTRPNGKFYSARISRTRSRPHQGLRFPVHCTRAVSPYMSVR